VIDHYEYGTCFYFGVDGSINYWDPLYGPTGDVYYNEDDPSKEKDKLIFEVPKVVADEEFHIYITNHAADGKEARIVWVYRPAKIPIIFIPGVGGSVLNNADTGSELWPNEPDVSLTLGTPNSANIGATDIVRDVAVFGVTPTDDQHVYGPFITALESWGYEEDRDLFVFPYDWRLDIYSHAPALDTRIDEILRSRAAEKVIIIAHSMGGMVARAYVDKYGSDKIETLITMGTPHLGSVKIYYSIVMGYDFGLSVHVDKFLMKHIYQTTPSSFQFLPTSPFITEESSGKTWSLDEAFSINYHGVTIENNVGKVTEDWPLSMNDDMLMEYEIFRNDIGSQIKDLDTYTIIGYRRATLSGYTAWKPSASGTDDVNDPKTYGIMKPDGSLRWLQPEFDDGDGTVTIESAKGLSGDIELFLRDIPLDSIEHGEIQKSTRVQSLIWQILDGSVDKELYKLPDKPGPLNWNEKGDWFIHSSANLHIYDSSGNHLGKNEFGSFDEEIPGSSFIEMNGLEYCSILNMSDSYRVEVVGFETGDFTLGFSFETEDSVYKFVYPDVEVYDGTVAKMDYSSENSFVEDPPSLNVESDAGSVVVDPVLIEVADVKDESGIPGFPVWSIVVALLVYSHILRNRIL